MKWQAISTQAVYVRSWDDEFVVYNSLSGDTHLLGAAAGQILTALQRSPSDETSLTESLCETLDAEPTPQISLQIRAILADLRKLALIDEVA
jgi:PqqD family protein of HPr-rel-A system